MAVFIVEDAPDLTIPADTILKAKLVDLNVHEFTYPDRKTGETKQGSILQWWFEVSDTAVADGKYVGRKVKGETDSRITNHPRNKFRLWAETLLGRDLPEGMPVDTDDLVGLPAEILIEHQADKKDPAKTYERVTGVLPATGSSLDEIPF